MAVALGGCAEPQAEPGSLQPHSADVASPHHFVLKVRHSGSDPQLALALDSIMYAFTLRDHEDTAYMREGGVVRLGQADEHAAILPSPGRFHLHVDAYAHFAYGQAESQRTAHDVTIDTSHCDATGSVPTYNLNLRVMYVEATPTVHVTGFLDC